MDAIYKVCIQINPSQKERQRMDQDFFGSTTDQPVSNYVPQQNHEEDEFDFGVQPTNNNFQPSSNSNIGYSDFQMNEAASRIRQEEDMIMEKLREKANKEYQDKQTRRQAGQTQYQEFLRRKEEEVEQRKRENKQKEQRNQEQSKKLNEQAGWRKVGANVGLKQGQHKSQRDTNRMRQAIINKRNDQSN